MCQCLFILPLFTSTNISVWTNFIQHSHIFIYKLLVFHYGVISVRKKTKQNKNIDLNWSELILRFYSGQKGIRYLKRNCVNMGILCNLPPPPRSFWVWHHCRNHKSQVCNYFSDVDYKQISLHHYSVICWKLVTQRRNMWCGAEWLRHRHPSPCYNTLYPQQDF